jgi:hypothetical protein
MHGNRSLRPVLDRRRLQFFVYDKKHACGCGANYTTIAVGRRRMYVLAIGSCSR